MVFKNDFNNHCRKEWRGCLNRALTILLCLLMLAAAVCGCSGTVSGEPGSVPEPSGEQTEPAGGPAGPEEDEENGEEKEHKEDEPVTEEDEQVDEQVISEEEGGTENDVPEVEDPDEIVEDGITIRAVPGGNRDIRNVKDRLIKISSGDTEGLHLEEYSGDQWIEDDGEDILYRDGDFLYAVFDLSGGMQQIYGTTAYSTDGGKTWYVNQLHHYCEWRGFYILDRRIIETDLLDFLHYIHDPHISFDYGLSYGGRIYSKSVYNILSLPGINESDLLVYGEVYSADREKNRISVRWVMGEDRYNTVPVLEKDVDYNTLEALDERDLSGLAGFADRYRDTGFLFPDSSTVLLDAEEVKDHYERELVFSAPEYAVKEIDLAIYEIYARYGMDFRGTVYDEYFLEKSWYYQDWLQEEDSVQLNEIEKANIELLKSIRKDIESSGSGED